jgi:hypothetical protein
MKQAFLVVFVILLGILIGSSYEEKTIYIEHTGVSVHQEIYKDKMIHTPTYLSEQLINYDDEHIKSRKTPLNKNEKIVAYFEDFHAKKYDEKTEVYERNGTVYINLQDKPQMIVSHGAKHGSTPMMPKLSASKRFISYVLCNDKNNSCHMTVRHIASKKEVILNEATNVTWHPQIDVLLYAVSKRDNEHNFTQSEVYMYDVHRQSITQLTDSSEFIETNPIFSKDGNTIYCDDAKTNRLVYFSLFGGNRNTHISAIKFYKTPNALLDIEEIKKRSALFLPIQDEERFCEKNMTYWIEIELDKDTKSGLYRTNTHPFLFNKNSFTPKQLSIEKKEPVQGIVYEYEGKYAMSFNYEVGIDETHYYFRLESYALDTPFFQGLFKVEEIKEPFYEPTNEQVYRYGKEALIYKLLSAMVIGMILMSALYTAIIYIYRRKKEFIYYTFMQVSMSLMLLTSFRGLFFSNNYVGEFSLLIAFFATLFTQAFLETKKYLPKMNMLLNFYLVLIIADMIWIFDPLMLKYKLYAFFGLLYLITAILRIKDGFKPAWFYLFGWIGLLLAIFLQDYFHFNSFTMFIGVFVEAVMLAWGLVYVSGFGTKNK